MTYDQTNKGTLAKNARKTDDKHPDITGSLNVDGTDYWINGWQKTNSKDGSKFYSLSVKPKDARPHSDGPTPGFVVAGDPPDDPIPF